MMLAIAGIFAFLFARSAVYVDGDAVATYTNLLEKESLTRLGIAAELLLVLMQALVAVWFYKIFSKAHAFAAGLIAVFGTVNAVAILISSALWLSALNAAVAGVSASEVFNLFNVHESIWIVSNIFFGLWLIPMGFLALRTNMPCMLAWFLMVGGIGYMLAPFILILLPEQKTFAEMVIIPASVGEFWMIGYLLIKSRLHEVNR